MTIYFEKELTVVNYIEDAISCLNNSISDFSAYIESLKDRNYLHNVEDVIKMIGKILHTVESIVQIIEESVESLENMNPYHCKLYMKDMKFISLVEKTIDNMGKYVIACNSIICDLEKSRYLNCNIHNANDEIIKQLFEMIIMTQKIVSGTIPTLEKLNNMLI